MNQIKSADDCPAVEKHTASPSGYVAWHDWAEKKSRRHKQIKCPTCGYLAIWKRK